MKNLLTRVLTGVILVPIVVGALYIGGIALWLLLFAVLVGAALEANRLMELKGLSIPRFLLILAIVVSGIGLFAVGRSLFMGMLLQISISMLILLLIPVFRQVSDIPSENIAEVLSIFLFLSIGGFSLWFIRIYSFWDIIFYLVLIWIFDTGGLVGGALAGRHKLAPYVSPNKSWEGLFMGYIWAAAYVPLANIIPGFRNAVEGNIWIMIAAILVISTVAQLGDLLESVWKREAEVKDSSNLFPGHGGVLDRIDSVFAAAPFYLLWLIFSRGLPF